MEAQRKLVVIGNGMAGARTVEEILARGGGDQFDITMFGEEPTGNYNRILLSNVLNGSYKEDEIFLNPLDWYRENNIRLLAGTRAAGILRRARLVFAEDGTPQPYDKLIIATGSRPFLLFKTPSLTYPQALLILGVADPGRHHRGLRASLRRPLFGERRNGGQTGDRSPA